MKRLTCRMDHGIIMQTGYDFSIDPDDYDLVQKILARLAAYEDTGLEPEEIAALKAENGRLQKENFWLTNIWRPHRAATAPPTQKKQRRTSRSLWTSCGRWTASRCG